MKEEEEGMAWGWGWGWKTDRDHGGHELSLAELLPCWKSICFLLRSVWHAVLEIGGF